MEPFHTRKNKAALFSLLLLLIAGIPDISPAQPGTKLIYSYQSTPSWNAAASEYFRSDHKLLEHYYGVGINYWMEHVRYNFGLAPGLYLIQSTSKISGRDTTFNYSDKALGFELDLSFVPFHPVKLNPWLDAPPMNGKEKTWKKSLFLQCTPALVWHHKRIDPAGEKHNGINFKIDFGMGYQLSLFRHIGISPVLKAGIQPGLKWKGFSSFHEAEGSSDSSLGTYYSMSLYFFYY